MSLILFCIKVYVVSLNNYVYKLRDLKSILQVLGGFRSKQEAHHGRAERLPERTSVKFQNFLRQVRAYGERQEEAQEIQVRKR